MPQPQNLNLPSEFDTLLQSHPLPILVDFWADWCAPCHAMAPVLKDLAQEWKGRLTVIKVNTEQKPHLAGRYGITAIPTLILFKSGREVHRISGALPLRQLRDEFSSFM